MISNKLSSYVDVSFAGCVATLVLKVTDREVCEILHGHYRIAYLIKTDDRIEILGIFHGAMEIERYLK